MYLLMALPAVAQSQAFATIAIKPARSGDARDTRMQVLPNGDLIASAVPVVRLLSYAYDVPVNPSPRLSVFRSGARHMISRRKRLPTLFRPVFKKAKRNAECRE
jgi:hypothetical protein